MHIIFSEFLILDQISCSPQVKRSVIICNKNKYCIDELSHELPYDLRLRILENWERLDQISQLHRIITQLPVYFPK